MFVGVGVAWPGFGQVPCRSEFIRSTAPCNTLSLRDRKCVAESQTPPSTEACRNQPKNTFVWERPRSENKTPATSRIIQRHAEKGQDWPPTMCSYFLTSAHKGVTGDPCSTCVSSAPTWRCRRQPILTASSARPCAGAPPATHVRRRSQFSGTSSLIILWGFWGPTCVASSSGCPNQIGSTKRAREVGSDPVPCRDAAGCRVSSNQTMDPRRIDAAAQRRPRRVFDNCCKVSGLAKGSKQCETHVRKRSVSVCPNVTKSSSSRASEEVESQRDYVVHVSPGPLPKHCLTRVASSSL